MQNRIHQCIIYVNYEEHLYTNDMIHDLIKVCKIYGIDRVYIGLDHAHVYGNANAMHEINLQILQRYHYLKYSMYKNPRRYYMYIRWDHCKYPWDYEVEHEQ